MIESEVFIKAIIAVWFLLMMGMLVGLIYLQFKIMKQARDLVVSNKHTPVKKEAIIGEASYYDKTYCENYNPSCITASGEKFDDTKLTSACDRGFPLGTILKVSYEGKSVVVKCNDTGSFDRYGRILDLSRAAFMRLSPLSKGVILVEIEEVG